MIDRPVGDQAGSGKAAAASRPGGAGGQYAPAARPTRSGPATGRMLAPFALADSEGRRVDLWDFRQRSNLVIFFHHGAGCPACRSYLQELARQVDGLREDEAVVLAVGPDSPESGRGLAGEIGRAFPILSDPDGRASRESRAQPPLVVVTDRFGQVWAEWDGGEGHLLPRGDDVQGWLALIEVQCPECGAPEWPLAGDEEP